MKKHTSAQGKGVKQVPSTSAVQTAYQRTPVKKSLRFEIFKRDKFTCRYCGAQPPEVVLHVDHVLPVAAGGTNDEANLVTACESCNLGKRDKLLDNTLPPSDSDLRYLEIMQEKAELERAGRARRQLEDLRYNEAIELMDMALVYSGEDNLPPDVCAVIRMLGRHEYHAVAEAMKIAATAIVCRKIHPEELYRYAAGCLKKMDRGGCNG